MSGRQLYERLYAGMRLGALYTAEDLLRGLTNLELCELSSLIEQTLFDRQRKELSSENTVVALTEDCF